MDERSFDRWTLSLMDRLSRRGLGRLGAGTLGIASSVLTMRDVADAKKKKKKKKCKAPKKKCGKKCLNVQTDSSNCGACAHVCPTGQPCQGGQCVASNGYLKWGSSGSGPGEFDGPEDIAVDAAGNVYVIEDGNNRVQKFTRTGSFVLEWGSQGSDDGQFEDPSGIAVDGMGNVFVSDTGNHRVQKFSGTGAFLTKWGSHGASDGQFAAPRGLAVDSANNVYVADSFTAAFNNDRIQKFTNTGTFLTKWGSEGSDDGQFDAPVGIATDSAGNVYVADNGNNRVQKFTSTGSFLTKWGSSGCGDGQFFGLSGLAIDAVDYIFTAEGGCMRIQRFAPVSTSRSDVDASESAQPQLAGVKREDQNTSYSKRPSHNRRRGKNSTGQRHRQHEYRQ